MDTSKGLSLDSTPRPASSRRSSPTGPRPAIRPDSGAAESGAWGHPLSRTASARGPAGLASTIIAGGRQLFLPVQLLLLTALLGHAGAVAGHVEFQDDRVVDDPVDGRGGGHGIGEDALPLGEDQVGGDAQ